MADLAIAFRWRPADMDGMELAELMDWRELARERMTHEQD
jgi:hypothetical protein